MTLGLALIIVFVLYLIDKHNRWRQAIKVTIGLVVLAILGIGGFWGWGKYQEYKTEEREAAYQAKMKPFNDCFARNSQFSNVTEECEKDPSVALQAAPPPKFVIESPPVQKPKNAAAFGWALISPSFGETTEIYKRCNFDAVGSSSPIEACDFSNPSIAEVHKGDQVQLLSRKMRAPSGDEIYEVRFQQWTGWIGAGEITADQAPADK